MGSARRTVGHLVVRLSGNLGKVFLVVYRGPWRKEVPSSLRGALVVLGDAWRLGLVKSSSGSLGDWSRPGLPNQDKISGAISSIPYLFIFRCYIYLLRIISIIFIIINLKDFKLISAVSFVFVVLI